MRAMRASSSRSRDISDSDTLSIVSSSSSIIAWALIANGDLIGRLSLLILGLLGVLYFPFFFGPSSSSEDWLFSKTRFS